jgi:hypothetical protein
MRSENELRQRLATEIIMYAGFATKDSIAARACWERCRVIEWCLEPTMPMSEIPEPHPDTPAPSNPDPPDRRNGSSDKLAAVTVPEDDEGGDDE